MSPTAESTSLDVAELIREQCVRSLRDGNKDFDLLVQRVMSQLPKGQDFPLGFPPALVRTG